MEIVGAAVSAMQLETNHDATIQQTTKLYTEQRDQQDAHHEVGLKLSANLHKSAQSLARELNSRRYVHKMHLAHKESVRDVWQQRNELVQTMMIVSTLMFGCAYTVLVDGRAPPNVTGSFLALHAVFVSGGLLLLLATIVGLLALYSVMSSYELHRPLKRYPGCNRNHKTFADFYQCHCHKLHLGCMGLFYVGSLVTIIACSMLAVSKFHYTYKDTTSSVLFCCILALGCVVPTFGNIVWPGRTEHPTANLERPHGAPKKKNGMRSGGAGRAAASSSGGNILTGGGGASVNPVEVFSQNLRGDYPLSDQPFSDFASMRGEGGEMSPMMGQQLSALAGGGEQQERRRSASSQSDGSGTARRGSDMPPFPGPSSTFLDVPQGPHLASSPLAMRRRANVSTSITIQPLEGDLVLGSRQQDQGSDMTPSRSPYSDGMKTPLSSIIGGFSNNYDQRSPYSTSLQQQGAHRSSTSPQTNSLQDNNVSSFDSHDEDAMGENYFASPLSDGIPHSHGFGASTLEMELRQNSTALDFELDGEGLFNRSRWSKEAKHYENSHHPRDSRTVVVEAVGHDGIDEAILARSPRPKSPMRTGRARSRTTIVSPGVRSPFTPFRSPAGNAPLEVGNSFWNKSPGSLHLNGAMSKSPTTPAASAAKTDDDIVTSVPTILRTPPPLVLDTHQLVPPAAAGGAGKVPSAVDTNVDNSASLQSSSGSRGCRVRRRANTIATGRNPPKMLQLDAAAAAGRETVNARAKTVRFNNNNGGDGHVADPIEHYHHQTPLPTPECIMVDGAAFYEASSGEDEQ